MLFRALNNEAGGSQVGDGQFISVVRKPFDERVTDPSPFVRGDSPMYESEKKNAVSPFGKSKE
ncbi:MAG TPA: hypothetical protein VMZ26_02695, partial [Pyrinomonadaceae bacterium]|nr:hypothetical protein [Pyrinomonadaceae bacterium]